MARESVMVVVLLTLGCLLVLRLLYRFMCGFSMRSPMMFFPSS